MAFLLAVYSFDGSGFNSRLGHFFLIYNSIQLWIRSEVSTDVVYECVNELDLASNPRLNIFLQVVSFWS